MLRFRPGVGIALLVSASVIACSGVISPNGSAPADTPKASEKASPKKADSSARKKRHTAKSPGNSQGPAKSRAQRRGNTPSKTGAKAGTKAVDIPANLAKNPGFETWGDNGPANWNVAGERDGKWTPSIPEKTAETNTGSFAAALVVPEGSHRVSLSQSIPNEFIVTGRRVNLSAMVKPSEGQAVSMVLTFAHNGKVETVKRDLSGKKEWVKLSISAWFPKNEEIDKVRIAFICMRAGNGTVLVDDVSLKYNAPAASVKASSAPEPPAPAESVPDTDSTVSSTGIVADEAGKTGAE